MLLFIALEIGIGLFLYKHQNKKFLVFDPVNDALLSGVVKKFGITFMAVGALTIIPLLIQNTILISVSLIIGCIMILSFQLTMVKFFPK